MTAVVAAWMATGLGGCNGEVYVRDGVTDGDTFYLAEWALYDDDPVVQSWVRYSLARSTCQLGLGGENPARATSFDCEVSAREHLLEAWSELARGSRDAYLDTLADVREAGFLDEYVWEYLRRPSWNLPTGLDRTSFDDWRGRQLPGHEPRTRWVGSWGYARRASAEGFVE